MYRLGRQIAQTSDYQWVLQHGNFYPELKSLEYPDAAVQETAWLFRSFNTAVVAEQLLA